MSQRATYNLTAMFAAGIILEVLFWVIFGLVYFVVVGALPGLRWDKPEMAWLFLTGPLVLIIFMASTAAKNKKLKLFADAKLLKYLVPDISSVNVALKYILIRLALAFAIIALVNPKLGSKMAEAKIKGIDIVIAIDVSNSMLAEDLKPNRLVRATRDIEKMLEKLRGDRIGIVVFAGQAYVQLPITNDYAAGKLFLSAINTDIVPVQGTAIGSAIELSMESFDLESPAQKTIIVITDGENHEDDAIAAAESAAESGVKIYTIGMGSPEGTPIPEFSNGRRTGFKKDREGQVVVSKLNETMLRDIASAGGGSYIRASNAEVGLQPLLEELNTIEKTEMGSVVYAEYEDRFQVFLLLAIACLILEHLLRRRKGKLMKRIKLFN